MIDDDDDDGDGDGDDDDVDDGDGDDIDDGSVNENVCEQVVGNMTTTFGSFFSENPARVLSGTSKHANKETTKKNELNIVGDGKRDGKTKLSYQDLCTFTILQFSIVTASVFDFFVCSLA